MQEQGKQTIRDRAKTRDQLLAELTDLRQKLVALEQAAISGQVSPPAHADGLRSQALMDALPDLMFRLDRQGIFLDYRVPADTLLYVEPSEFLGKSIDETMTADIADRFHLYSEASFTNAAVQVFEYRLPTPDGVRDYEARLVCSGEDEITTIIRDITVAAALQDSEEKYRMFFSMNQDAVVLIDAASKQIIDANPAASQLYGYSYEELLQLSALELSDMPAHSVEKIQEVLSNPPGSVHVLQSRHKNKAGQSFAVEVASGTFPHQERTLIYAIFRDVTERIQAQRELETLITELEGRNAELERFTYTVSHDLQSPLITIKGFLGFIEADIAKGNYARVPNDFQRIADAADRMTELMDNLLALSRIGRVMNEPESFRFEDLLHEVLGQLTRETPDKKRTFEVIPCPHIIVGDRLRIGELLTNLIENAIYFTHERPDPRIVIGSRLDDQTPVYYVQDNGIGIVPIYHTKVFDLFEQLNPHGDGSGIGLAIAKRIVEIHGGRIWVESDGLDTGATFCFTLGSAQ